MSGERDLPVALGGLVAAIGTPDFPRRLLDTFRLLAGVDLCSAFLHAGQFAHGDPPQMILAVGELPGVQGFPLRAAHAYARDFWRSDRQLSLLVQAPAGKPLVVRRRAVDIADPAYRGTCYDPANVTERISILAPGRPGLMIHGYRTAGSPPLAPQHIVHVEHHAGLLLAALRQHMRAALSGPAWVDEVALAGRLAALDCGLSVREAEVAAALILGETQERIARAKRLSPATIITYRRRAYGKLGVGNRHDLIALHRRLAEVDRTGNKAGE